MDMLMGDKIAAAKLADWRKLAQGLHARYLVEDFSASARFVTAIAEVSEAADHQPKVFIGKGFVDLELVSDDAVYRPDDDTEFVVEWVTQRDLDLAGRITEVAAGLNLTPDPASVSEIELGLDTAESGTIAPVWAALLTGNPEDQGRGTPGDEVRDARARIPNLWFGDLDPEKTQKLHFEVYVAPEVVEQRIAGAVAAGGTIVDDSESPGLTVIADQEGNTGIICADLSAAPRS